MLTYLTEPCLFVSILPAYFSDFLEEVDISVSELRQRLREGRHVDALKLRQINTTLAKRTDVEIQRAKDFGLASCLCLFVHSPV